MIVKNVFKEIVFFSIMTVCFYKKYFSLVTGPPEGDLDFVFKKFLDLNAKNGPFCAAFIMGGVPTIEKDLTALFDLIKTEYTSNTLNS